MVDGTIARKTKGVSKFGARFDTVADAVFTGVCFVRILPLVYIPVWLRIWIAVIVTIKIGNVLWEFLRRKRLLSVHSFLNKATGFLLFLFPLTINLIEPLYSSVVVSSLAMLAALNEWYCVAFQSDERMERSL